MRTVIIKSGKAGPEEAMAEYMGKRVVLTALTGETGETGITIPAVVTGVRVAYGRVNLLVEPVYGGGRAWVRTDRVKVVSDWSGIHGAPQARRPDKGDKKAPAKGGGGRAGR